MWMCVCVCVQGAVQRLKTKLLRYGVKINVDIVAAAAPAHYLGLLMSCCQCKHMCVCLCVCVHGTGRFAYLWQSCAHRKWPAKGAY